MVDNANGKACEIHKKMNIFFILIFLRDERVLRTLTRKTDITITYPVNKFMEIQVYNGHL